LKARKRSDVFSFFKISNIVIIAAVALAAAVLFYKSESIFQREGLSFLTQSTWNPAVERYGVLFAVGGTLLTAAIAVSLSLFLSIASSVAIVELIPKRMKSAFSALIDAAAAIPSVIYGLWGLLILSPILKAYVMDPFYRAFGPVLGIPRGLGTSLFSASVVLAIMVLPFATSIIRERLYSVPPAIKEALISLGMTRWEYIRAEISYIRRSIISAVLVAYGRAIGETAAVALVVGNMVAPDFYKIFNPGYTISSLIANQYMNAGSYEYMESAIFGAALILFALSAVINLLIARFFGEKL